jgi:hypothetical protein
MKSEPHPERKAHEGKWRLVTSISIVDQLVERVLFTNLLSQVKSFYPESGMTIGLGFNEHHAEGMFSEFDKMRELSGGSNVISNDVKSFEKVHSRSYIINDAAMACDSLMEAELYPCVTHAIKIHAYLITDPLFMVPGSKQGDPHRLFSRAVPGGTCSGVLTTTLYTSATRIDAGLIAGALFVKAMGDDSGETWGEDATQQEIVDKYRELGFTLRSMEVNTADEISFCSHTFKRVGDETYCTLNTWRKALYKLLSRKITNDRAFSFKSKIYRNPLYPEMVKTILEYGVFIESEETSARAILSDIPSFHH